MALDSAAQVVGRQYLGEIWLLATGAPELD
jgi:hypothetical protein